MKDGILLGAALLAIPATAALAQNRATELTPAQVVAARRAGYFLSAGTISMIKTEIDGTGELRETVFWARALASWARVIPTLFPEGTAISPSTASDAVWNDRADFQARADAYATAATRLAALAAAGDRAGATAQYAALRATCNACHEGYRLHQSR